MKFNHILIFAPKSCWLTSVPYVIYLCSQYIAEVQLSRANEPEQEETDQRVMTFFPLQTQKHYALPLIRQSQDSYQPSQRQQQRQLPRSIISSAELRFSEEAIQSDNPKK
ncbi:Hypothetical_protein [Hexamita inflata]|uniref:Hypothetical_protein n=1 Tax=Hexamita inflata TaxID=28002 RepID=A0AA86NCR8_9EUKA|nr:Hypothetical protein HINF_LOCUS4511 [Hexamita inflata]